jgi:hypothetical protein
MLASLKTRTTYPPVILTNTITSNTILSPQAQRDTDIPDLGYHYDALDYFVSCIVSNAAVTLTNGVALAYNYSDWTGGGGFMLQNGSNFVSQGSAVQRNYIVHHSLVQEGPAPLWTAYCSYHTAQVNSMPINPYHSNTNLAPGISLRDTTIVVPAGSEFLIYSTTIHWNLTVLHCAIVKYTAATQQRGFTAHSVMILRIIFLPIPASMWKTAANLQCTTISSSAM